MENNQLQENQNINTPPVSPVEQNTPIQTPPISNPSAGGSKPKYSFLVIIGIILFLVIVGSVAGFFIFKQQREKPVLETTPTPTAIISPTIEISQTTSPTASPSPSIFLTPSINPSLSPTQSFNPNDLAVGTVQSGNNKTVSIKLKNISVVKSIDYEVNYDAIVDGDTVPRGAIGSAIIEPSQNTFTREVVLGTCKQSVCKYDQGINNIEVIVNLTLNDGSQQEIKRSLPNTI